MQERASIGDHVTYGVRYFGPIAVAILALLGIDKYACQEKPEEPGIDLTTQGPISRDPTEGEDIKAYVFEAQTAEGEKYSVRLPKELLGKGFDNHLHELIPEGDTSRFEMYGTTCASYKGKSPKKGKNDTDDDSAAAEDAEPQAKSCLVEKLGNTEAVYSGLKGKLKEYEKINGGYYVTVELEDKKHPITEVITGKSTVQMYLSTEMAQQERGEGDKKYTLESRLKKGASVSDLEVSTSKGFPILNIELTPYKGGGGTKPPGGGTKPPGNGGSTPPPSGGGNCPPGMRC